MKKNIHPEWHDDAVVTCACGNSFTTGSIHPSLQVEICAKCHPFFTGEMKFVDTQGRVEKFAQKRKESEARRAALEAKMAEKNKKEAEERAMAQTEIKSYKQILAQTQTNMGKKSKKTEVKKAAEVKNMEEVVAKSDTKSEKAE